MAKASLQPNSTSLPMISTQGISLCTLDTKTNHNPSPGYADIRSPHSLHVQLQPNTYTQGLNSSGTLIGVNNPIPYPNSNVKYFEIPFNRSVDWCYTQVAGDLELKRTCLHKIIKEKAEKCKELNMLQTEPAEYFTAENDEGYNQWVSRQMREKEEIEMEKAKRRIVPNSIKAMPGHYNPSTLETSNEAYGQYIDLRPKYPATYPLSEKIPPMPMQVLVKFRPSNISDHPRIPDHVFAVDPRELITKKGCYSRGTIGALYFPHDNKNLCKTVYSFKRSQPYLSGVAGERKPGHTWPLYSPTGLELNRPVPRCVSVIAGVDGKEKCRLSVPARSVPYVYNRYVSCTCPQSKDPETEPNPQLRQTKQNCAPCNPLVQSNPRCDPCHLDFINPQFLPVPMEIKQQQSSNVNRK
ncbi:uncharacterized protein LOC131952170 [Physella acuta]|uniref:uncharacterized protein LOC131952170 n=1 Tax=Physella acuta TaxID=109671 RepID=UPI0027DADC11|nr:uncharacterized protein LOC131952170 [Physella acuta]